MKIAVVSSPIIGQTDQLLSDVAIKLQTDGVNLSGVVKVQDSDRPDDHHCDMDIRVLPDGPEIRITQSLGEGSKGCRLNPASIAEAVAETEQKDLSAVDMFILNKFGPQEAEGRGFCDAIASALANGTPVLVGVGGGCRDALDAFVDGMAEVLPPEPAVIQSWCQEAISDAAANKG